MLIGHVEIFHPFISLRRIHVLAKHTDEVASYRLSACANERVRKDLKRF